MSNMKTTRKVEKVLIVEDDQETAELLSDNLREDGYRVTPTRSPHDATPIQ